MSDLPRSRATAVQALIDEVEEFVGWWGLNREGSVNRTYDHIDKLTKRLAALLLREGPPQESQLSPTTECPDGEKHVLRCIRCELPATGLREGQEPPARLQPDDYVVIKDAVNNYLGYDVTTLEQQERIAEWSAGLREGPPAPPGHAGDPPATEPDTRRCSQTDAIAKTAKFAAGDCLNLALDVESKPWNAHTRAGIVYNLKFYAKRLDELAQSAAALAASQAGEAPQEAMPDHCENCRAELPVTTVHLCHACLPSAPRDHAGEAPATEPAYKLKLYRCKVCGTRWLLWPEPLTTGGWNLLDHWQRPGSCCDNAAMGDQIEHLRDIPLAASQAGTAPREAEREIRETASQFDTWWRDHGALERLDQSHREAARAAFDAGRASRHTGDCRRWRLVTGHRRVYQGHHACTCGASNQREEPPT